MAHFFPIDDSPIKHLTIAASELWAHRLSPSMATSAQHAVGMPTISRPLGRLIQLLDITWRLQMGLQALLHVQGCIT